RPRGDPPRTGGTPRLRRRRAPISDQGATLTRSPRHSPPRVAEVVPVLAGRADTTHHASASNREEGTTMSTQSRLTEQLAAQQAEADRIASTFKVDEKGRFDIASGQYADYRKAVANVKEIKGLLDDMRTVDEVRNYL